MISEHGISAETTCRHKVYGTISKYSRAMLCRARPMRLQSIGACLLVIALLLGEHAATSAGAENELTGPSAARPQTTYRGGLVTPPLAKPNFTLTDTAGAPFAFLEMTQGNVTLLFFGYTRCPDQCPLHMANIAVSLKNMSGRRDLDAALDRLWPLAAPDPHRAPGHSGVAPPSTKSSPGGSQTMAPVTLSYELTRIGE